MFIKKHMNLSPESTFVAVMGMHRSGTSMTMNILSDAGFFVGQKDDLMAPKPQNPKGFFERNSVMAANDLILSIAGGSWDTPPDSSDIESIRVDPLIEKLLAVYQGKTLAAIKDPRLCLTCQSQKIRICWMRLFVIIRKNWPTKPRYRPHPEP